MTVTELATSRDWRRYRRRADHDRCVGLQVRRLGGAALRARAGADDARRRRGARRARAGRWRRRPPAVQIRRRALLRNRRRGADRQHQGRQDGRGEQKRRRRAARCAATCDGRTWYETSGATFCGTSPRTKSHQRAHARAGSATVSTPRPTCSRVTTADGRSPGSRVTTFRRLPGTRDAQWHDDGRFAAYSCGGSRGIGRSLASPRSLLIPEGNRRP